MRENSLRSDGDASQTPSLAGIRVLVVDDDEDSRFYISTVLAEEGASVTVVASATEALEVLPQLQPNILICDIGMPGEDGYSLIRKVRALDVDKGGNVLAVALTAYADSADRESALQAGFEIHVAKPVDPEELVTIVVNLVFADRS